MPETLTLGSLHLVIQQAMGWENKHLYSFEIHGKRFGPDNLDDEAITLKDVFKDKSLAVSYIYDFGDWWEHTVILDERYFKLADKLVVAGEGVCPAEDSGGVP